MQFILDYILSIFVTLSTIFSLIPGLAGNNTSYSPEKDGIILNCTVVSDTHFDKNSFRDRTNILRRTYAGIAESSRDIDVLLNIGDITNSGCEREYLNANKITNFYVKPKHMVACLGNHDSWHESADPNNELAQKLFIQYINRNGVKCDNVYYSTVIDGYRFICLATETLDIDGEPPTYSEEQIAWFDNELTKAEESNLPIFVLCHRPLSGYNGITSEMVPKAINDVLDKHSRYSKPIIVFTGHCHTLSPNWIDSKGSIYSIQLPSTEYNDEVEYECNDNGGMGLTMEVYENSIVFKARNFQKDLFVEGYRREIEWQ